MDHETHGQLGGNASEDRKTELSLRPTLGFYTE
jgi:hypothetical protein